MFRHRPAGLFAIARRAAQFNPSAARSGCALLLLAILAGCTAAPSAPLVASDPSDPNAPTQSVRYSSVLTGYTSQRPVGPLPWRERNERVTPKGDAQ